MFTSMLGLVLALYLVFIVVLLYVVFGGFLWGSMWMKLPRKRVQRMLELGNVSKDKVVFDLGAGYGNVAFQAADRKASVVAVEADWFKAWWIQTQINNKQLENVSCVKGNLLGVDLSKADVLLCYLSDTLMRKISKMPLKHGCLIVSACHKIEGWVPTVVDRDWLNPIYVYVVP